MKKTLIKLLALVVLPLSLFGCNQKKEEPITNKDESTIIKDAKSTDEYLKKQDYKSLAYAFIYNIKDGLKSYESSTTGNLKAKIAFIDYTVKYESITYKKGAAFYGKDHSSSTFTNVNNEFYMASKDKILVSRDLKKYDVYASEEFKKVSYLPSQYTVMGYVFNDQSILKSEVISDQGDIISIRYTLDNELATNIVKVDFKANGDLLNYPSFKNVQLTLSMKRDFTPVSYSINAVYDATRAIIGTATVTQSGECLFSKVNEDIIIPNETSLAEKLGATPSTINIDDSENNIKQELTEAAKKMDFANGVNVSGNLTLNLFDTPIVLTIGADVKLDLAKLTTDKIYSLFDIHAKLEGDETFNSLVSIIKTFAGDKLGEFAPVLDGFKSVEVSYDGNGSLYIVPTNTNNVHPMVLKTKLVTILDLLLQQINVYNLVTGAQNDIFNFKKIEGKDKDNYQVEITLTDDTISSIKESLNKLFEDATYGMIKALIYYKDFGEVKVTIDVKDGLISEANAYLSYLKGGSGDNPDSITNLVTIHLVAKNQVYDFSKTLAEAQALYTAYMSVQELKTRLSYLTSHVYLNNGYLADLNAAYEEYNALSDVQKEFIGQDIAMKVESAKSDIANLLLFLETYKKYDLAHLDNNAILALVKAYRLHPLNSKLLIEEIGNDNYNIVTDLGSKVDYTAIDNAIAKMNGDDENAWGLTEQEIKDIKVIVDISEYDSAVSFQILFRLMMAGKTMDADQFKAKINNLYSKIVNP